MNRKDFLKTVVGVVGVLTTVPMILLKPNELPKDKEYHFDRNYGMVVPKMRRSGFIHQYPLTCKESYLPKEIIFPGIKKHYILLFNTCSI